MSRIETFVTRPTRPGFVELLAESDVPDQHAAIGGCAHEWRPLLDQSLECLGACGVTLRGVLASQPPAKGMPWERACLVVSGRMAR